MLSSIPFKLTTCDYTKILNYYNIEVPANKKETKRLAEDVLAEKLCECIKKVSPDNEPKSIGICTRSIFKNKGLKRGTFNCRGKRHVKLFKTSKKISVYSKKTKTQKR